MCVITTFCLVGFFACLKLFIMNWNYWQVYHRGTTLNTTIISLSNMRRSVDQYRSFSRNTYSINSWMKTVSISRLQLARGAWGREKGCLWRFLNTYCTHSYKDLKIEMKGLALWSCFAGDWEVWNWKGLQAKLHRTETCPPAPLLLLSQACFLHSALRCNMLNSNLLLEINVKMGTSASPIF